MKTKTIIASSFLFFFVSCQKDDTLKSISHKSDNIDSLKNLLSILEQENKSKTIENNQLKSENKFNDIQNNYIKKITSEYNSIQTTLSELLQKQILIINSTNNLEENHNSVILSSAFKLKQYIELLETAYKNSNYEIRGIENQLKLEREKINILTDEINNNTSLINELRSIVNNLTREIERRDYLLSILKDKIKNLNFQIISLTSELNSAYYLIGTEEYLIDHNILTKKGGINLGLFSLGKVLVTTPGYNISTLFNKLDIRNSDEIKLLDKKEYQILPNRIDNSYTIYYNHRYKSYFLKIIDKYLFWKDRFLVIAYDE